MTGSVKTCYFTSKISGLTPISCFHDLTLSAPSAKSWSFADGIDQDQTAQNVQSDLDLCRPLVKSDICGTIICGTL